LSVCSWALSIQHEVRMHHIVTCCLPRSAIFCLPYHTNGKIFEKKKFYLKYVFIFYTTFVWNIIQSKKNWERYDKKIYMVFMQRAPVILVRFYWTWTFDRFWKNIQMSNLIKIRPVGAEVFRADGRMEGQTDRQTWRN
jgi:hypothetical protein